MTYLIVIQPMRLHYMKVYREMKECRALNLLSLGTNVL